MYTKLLQYQYLYLPFRFLLVPSLLYLSFLQKNRKLQRLSFYRSNFFYLLEKERISYFFPSIQYSIQY